MTPPFLDDPIAQLTVQRFILEYGGVRVKGHTVWDRLGINKSTFYRYKNTHPEFQAKLDIWRGLFLKIQTQRNGERFTNCWKEFDRRLADGTLSDAMLKWYLTKFEGYDRHGPP